MNRKSRREFLKAGIGIGTGVAAAAAVGCAQSPDSGNNKEDFFKVVHSRRSVRMYKPDPVPTQDIEKILESAKLCPTASNRQPWKFLIIQDKDKIESLKKATIDYRLSRRDDTADKDEESVREEIAKGLSGYFSAPVFIGVLTDSEAPYPGMNSHDGPIVASYICLVARAMNYGTVYMTGSVPGIALRKAANIPDRYDVTCVIALGVPKSWPETPSKKPLKELIVREEFV